MKITAASSVVASSGKDEKLVTWRKVESKKGKRLFDIRNKLKDYMWYGGWCECGPPGFHDGKWMVVHFFGDVATSIDNGETWTKVGDAPFNEHCSGGVVYQNGAWFMKSTYSVAWSEDDGVSWTKGGDFGGDMFLGGMAYDGTDSWFVPKFGYDSENEVMRSIDDCQSWTKVETSLPIEYCRRVGYGNGRLLITSEIGGVAYSTNCGKDWTRQMRMPPQLDADRSYFTSYGGATYGDGKWVVISTNGAVFASDGNGENWTQVDDGSLSKIASDSDTADFDDRAGYLNKWTGCPTFNGEVWLVVNRDGTVAISGGSRVEEGSIKFTNVTDDFSEHKINEQTTLYIEPSKISDTKDSDGNYYVELNMKNIRLISAEITNRPYTKDSTTQAIEFEKPRLPQMSRVIDFSKKATDGTFFYNITTNGTDNGTEINGNSDNDYILYSDISSADISKMGIRWNTTLNCWEYYDNDNVRNVSASLCNHINCQNYTGDLYLLIDVPYNLTEQPYFYWYRNTGYVEEYVDAGLTRKFDAFYDTWNDNGSRFRYAYEICKSGVGGIPAIVGGMTMPINAVLYYGVGADSNNPRQRHYHTWQSDTNGTVLCDATTACQKATVDAIKKLKADYGENIRIYVIKYRKQGKYKHKTTGIETDFVYDYIDSCEDIYNVYDAATSANIATILTTIAADIKSFAAYSAAQNQ